MGHLSGTKKAQALLAAHSFRIQSVLKSGAEQKQTNIKMTYDKDIREPLFEFLEDEYGKCRILEEKNTGRSRADVVMITENEICGIEIKSDADTYARLAHQVKDYDLFYDRNIVVVGTKHAMHIEEHVPDHWGIITVEPVEGVLDFYYLRRPRPNPKVRWEYKLSLLWRPELAKLQAMHDMPKYKDYGREYVIDRIVERLSGNAAENTSETAAEKTAKNGKGNAAGNAAKTSAESVIKNAAENTGKTAAANTAGRAVKSAAARAADNTFAAARKPTVPAAAKRTSRMHPDIDENELQAELCDLLFERDYTKIAEQLKEYRKSETQKKLEAETDPVKRLEIMMNKPKVPKRSKRRRRRGLF